MTDRVVGPLREARLPLFEGLQLLQAAAAAVHTDAVGAIPAIDRALDYLHRTFIPLSRAEEFTLYPAVDGAIGSVGATGIMVAQHETIAEMIADLDRVMAAMRPQGGAVASYAPYLLPLLYGLYAAVRMHIEAEDTAYLDLLDEYLSESQVGMIVDNLRRLSMSSAAP